MNGSYQNAPKANYSETIEFKPDEVLAYPNFQIIYLDFIEKNLSAPDRPDETEKNYRRYFKVVSDSKKEIILHSSGFPGLINSPVFEVSGKSFELQFDEGKIKITPRK